METEICDAELRKSVLQRLDMLRLVEFFEISVPDGSIVVEVRGIAKDYDAD